jgi:hypothetical protein
MRWMALFVIVPLVGCGLDRDVPVAGTEAPARGNAFFPPNDAPVAKARGGGSNLVYHNGGPVLHSAKVVYIFWGPSFVGSDGSPSGYAATLQGFRNKFGTTPQYNVITQYYDGVGSIQQSNLAAGTADWFDTTTPPTNVTDADLQAEVNRYLATHAFDNETIYEVVLPSSSYSSNGSSTSCGGPNLQYCAYHGYFGYGSNKAKYAVIPYASCGGCTTSGFTDAQNAQHFICHETREAVTDPLLNAWYDRRGNEADDKCAWSPTPFLDSDGYAYQYEWSNKAGACVQSM